MSASAATSELLRSSILTRSSCPAFGILLKNAEDLDGDDSRSESSESSYRPQLKARATAHGGGWFEEQVENVGAPRPSRPAGCRSPTSQSQRTDALDKVARMAERYRARVEHHRPAVPRTSRSSPDLQGLERAEAKELKSQDRSAGEKILKLEARGGSHSNPCLAGVGSCTGLIHGFVNFLKASILGSHFQGLARPEFDAAENAVIIFDWDDTLLPTTFILQTVLMSLPEKDRAGVIPEESPYKAALAAHAHLVGFILRAARRVARVAIVSNSLSPWVSASAARYLPGLDVESLLQELDVPIYYSRRHLPDIKVNYQVHRWQVEIDRTAGGRIGVDIIPEAEGWLTVARIEDGGLMDSWNMAHPSQAVQPGDHFEEVNGRKTSLTTECRKLHKLNISVSRAVPERDPYMEAKRIDMSTCLDKFYPREEWRKNVISIGDAMAEQEALKEVLRDLAEPSFGTRAPLCKTVNLLDHPSLEQLSSELRILLVWLSHMVKYDKDFDLAMDKLDDLERELFQNCAK
ncbi:unnamed protein product [Polarella glacialis]|uniref:PDZ domain-containing protein n=1 Tax=Polarella glacialis TaxID=89957 RepID=A0A813JCB2_POLGL|nr:unnamed protein product [Polarella glacialis]